MARFPHSWLRALAGRSRVLTIGRRKPTRRPRPFVPHLHPLEDRTLLNTYTVSNLADSGPGSLRQAVLDANAHHGTDRIVFAARLRGTIALTSGELNITDANLTVIGPGAGRLAVSGSDHSRVLAIAAGVATEVDGLTIAHGLATEGGGIANFGARLTVMDSILDHNQALGDPGSDGRGGGILNDSGGTLRVRRSLFTDNEARGGDGGMGGVGRGGGLFNAGNADVRQTTFRDNRAVGGGGSVGGNGIGGGISNAGGGVLTLSHATLSDNRAEGAPRSGAGTFPVNGGANGGGLLNLGATATVSYSRFTRNVSMGGTGAAGVNGGNGTGAGIATGSFDLAAAITVSHSTFSDNQSLGGAGGLGAVGGNGEGAFRQVALSTLPTQATLDHDTFERNQAVGGRGGDGGTGGIGGGGAVRTTGATANLVMTHDVIRDNEARGGDGQTGGDGRGGGVYVESGQARLAHLLVTSNRAVGGAGGNGGTDGQGVGGGLYVAAGATVSLRHSRIRHNHASTSDDDCFGCWGTPATARCAGRRAIERTMAWLPPPEGLGSGKRRAPCCPGNRPARYRALAVIEITSSVFLLEVGGRAPEN